MSLTKVSYSMINGASVNVLDFGAVGDGVTDDTAAVQNAIDSISGGIVVFPFGTYKLTSTVTVDSENISLEGENSTLLISHSSGAGLRVKQAFCSVKNFTIAASAARTAAAAGTNYGLMLAGDDVFTNGTNFGTFKNLVIYGHPSHGLLSVGRTYDSIYEQMEIYFNGGHGIVFDNGSKFGYTNQSLPGICRVAHMEIHENGGNGLVVGNNNSVSNRGIRFQIECISLYQNASDAAVKISSAQGWVFADTTYIRSGSASGEAANEYPPQNVAYEIYGTAIEISNMRFLNLEPTAVKVGAAIDTFNTDGIHIHDNFIRNDFATSLDPAVSVETGATNVQISWPSPIKIDAPKPLDTNAVAEARVFYVDKFTNQIVNNSSTYTDDTDLKFAMLPKQRAFFKFNIFYQGDSTASIKFQVLGPSGSTVTYGPTNSVRINGLDTPVLADQTNSSGTYGVGSSATEIRALELTGVITTGGTAGNLRLLWAQSAATAVDTTVLANSCLIVTT